MALSPAAFRGAWSPNIPDSFVYQVNDCWSTMVGWHQLKMAKRKRRISSERKRTKDGVCVLMDEQLEQEKKGGDMEGTCG